MLSNILNGKASNFTAEQIRAANVDCNTEQDAPLLDGRDLSLISQYLTGVIAEFPKNLATVWSKDIVHLSLGAYRAGKDGSYELLESVGPNEKFLIGIHSVGSTPIISQGWIYSFLLFFNNASYDRDRGASCWIRTSAFFKDSKSESTIYPVSGVADESGIVIVDSISAQADSEGLNHEQLTVFLNAFELYPEKSLTVQNQNGGSFCTHIVLADRNEVFYSLTLDKEDFPAPEPDAELRLLFNPMGGEMDIYEKVVSKGDTYGELPVPVRAGYDFVGWYAVDGGGRITSDTVADIEEDTTHYLYAHWTPSSYTLSFDGNGGNVSFFSKTVIYMEPYGELPTASRDKYVFDGWHTDLVGGVAVQSDDDYDLTGSQTLYAHWKLDDSNAPTIALGNVSGRAGERVSVPIELKNNSGICALLLSVSYDTDALTLLYARDGGILGDATFGDDKNAVPYRLLWIDALNSDGNKSNGTIATLVFQIKSGTGTGDYAISSVVQEAYNQDEEAVSFVTQNGIVTVLPSERYTVRFDANGGTVDGLTVKTVSVDNGQPIEDFPIASREGYRFDGWLTARDGGEEFTSETAVSANMTVYAHWSVEDITVRFDANGGSVTPDKISVPPGTVYKNLPTPEWDGHKFLGWFTSKDGGREITEGIPLEETREHTLYAHWSKSNVAVTVDFDYNGGSESILYKNVISGQPYGSLPSASRENYVFDGWYTDRLNGDKVTAETIVESDSDHYLYAHWSQPAVTIRFDLNGGTGSGLAKRTVQYGQPYGDLPTEIYWDKNHEFIGWFVKMPSGEEKNVSPTTLVPIAANHSLYARWEVKKVKVNLDPNGGIMGKTREFFVEYGGAYGDFLLENEATREGYEFRGWWTSDTGGSKVTNLTTLKSLENHVLYAHWRLSTQKVYFDPNDYGGVSRPWMIVQNGKPYGTLPSFIPSDSTYELEGWYVNPSENDKGQQITSRTVVDLDAEQTLYAHVRLKDRFTVTFDLNGVEGIVTPISVSVKNGETYGDAESLSGNLPIPLPVGSINHKFIGWFTDKERGKQIASKTEVNLSNNQTLYARWEITGTTYTVNLNPNGDGATVSPASIQVENGKAYGDLPTPVWTNCVFSGWYTESVGGEQIRSTTKANLEATQTLYAHWTENQTFDVTKDAYAFGNTASAFEYSSRGPGESYPISYEAFELIFGNTVAGKSQYRSAIQNLWGGNCNGMSSTVALLFSDSNINPSDFQKADAVSLLIHDQSNKIGPLSGGLNPTARTFIEAMQISQYTEPFAKAYKQNRLYQYQLDDASTLDGLYQAVEAGLNANKCTIIALGNSGQRVAHALLAYRLENVSETEIQMYVYDCNYPNAIRYVTMRRNAKNEIKNWSYEIGGSYGLWESGSGSECYISYIPYETIESIWENRGHLYSNHSMLTVNVDNLSITTGIGSKIQEVAKLVNGRLVTESDEIYDVPNLSLSLSGQNPGDSGTISIYLPTDEYTILTDADGELKASMVDYNIGAEVSTTANSVTFQVEDLSLTNKVWINGATIDDTFSAELESGYDGDKIHSLSASGTGADGTISIFVNDGNKVEIAGISEDKLDLALNSVTLLNTDRSQYISDEAYSVQDVQLDKERGVVSATVRNQESATIIAAIYDANQRGLFVTARTKDIDANAGKVELDFTETNFPENCKVKAFLMDSKRKKLLARYDK